MLRTMLIAPFTCFSSHYATQNMDALSIEWRVSVKYAPGDRVAFKIPGSLGVAAFECLLTHISTPENQPVAGGNMFWKHYPKGFPRS